MPKHLLLHVKTLTEFQSSNEIILHKIFQFFRYAKSCEALDLVAPELFE